MQAPLEPILWTAATVRTSRSHHNVETYLAYLACLAKSLSRNAISDHAAAADTPVDGKCYCRYSMLVCLAASNLQPGKPSASLV